jgi:hypothetical protein
VLTKIFGPRLSSIGTRAYDTGPLLDTILICGAATILIIRSELWLTHYPQLGGHGLHIAHLLWGGLGMLIAVVLLVSFLSPVVRRIGAFLGGIGLGFFIDELGKFVTSDNNYFFKPTAAIIYIFFIGFYLVTRVLQTRYLRSPQDYLVNALELSKDAATGGMVESERQLALDLLAQADHRNPLVEPLRAYLRDLHVRSGEEMGVAQHAVASAKAWYARVAGSRWFIRVVTAVFVLWGLLTIIEIIALIFTLEPHLAHQRTVKIVTPLTSKAGGYGFVEWANIVASFVAGLLVVWGFVRLRRSRLGAYVMWDHAVMVDIFFVQVFAFIQSQFGACLGFVLDIVLLVSVRFMAAREREQMRSSEEEEKPEPTVARPVPA